jgi:hypothetical protein
MNTTHKIISCAVAALAAGSAIIAASIAVGADRPQRVDICPAADTDPSCDIDRRPNRSGSDGSKVARLPAADGPPAPATGRLPAADGPPAPAAGRLPAADGPPAPAAGRLPAADGPPAPAAAIWTGDTEDHPGYGPANPASSSGGIDVTDFGCLVRPWHPFIACPGITGTTDPADIPDYN